MSDIVQKLWGFCHTLRHDGVENNFDNTPLLQGRGGAAKAKRVFGELNLLVDQLNEAVAA